MSRMAGDALADCSRRPRLTLAFGVPEPNHILTEFEKLPYIHQLRDIDHHASAAQLETSTVLNSNVIASLPPYAMKASAVVAQFEIMNFEL